MVDVICQAACAPNVATVIPGQDMPLRSELVDAVNAADESDVNLTGSNVTTAAVVGDWVQLMPANAARDGATVQAKSGNVFVKQLDGVGFPANGAQVGEIQVPAAPGYYTFDFDPKRRYVMRGDAASIVVSLQTW